jgi:hypothetical protein
MKGAGITEMLNIIGTFFNKIDRRAEHTDSHQSVLRQNPDEQSSKKGKKEEESEYNGNDTTHVSIDSLILLLKSALPKEETNAEKVDTPPQESLPSPSEQPENRQQIQAAKAYQKTYAATHYDDTAAPPQNPDLMKDNSAAQSTGLATQDVKTIHILINELTSLRQQGIRSLPIREGKEFLDSLVEAIKDRKNAAL